VAQPVKRCLAISTDGDRDCDPDSDPDSDSVGSTVVFMRRRMRIRRMGYCP